eukprot:431736-Pleurochrysis_carterae.AAC.5
MRTPGVTCACTCVQPPARAYDCPCTCACAHLGAYTCAHVGRCACARMYVRFACSCARACACRRVCAGEQNSRVTCPKRERLCNAKTKLVQSIQAGIFASFLREQDKVTEEDIAECLRTFEQLDVDGSGRLDQEDVELWVRKLRAEATSNTD